MVEEFSDIKTEQPFTAKFQIILRVIEYPGQRACLTNVGYFTPATKPGSSPFRIGFVEIG
ncbi:hypothetical protein [Candidatus Vondammii sp. HM_W22]|uniref:hypothetical protein n=1 Tax=Candidatus Vondammii sp. HM_W22 TaxID=2687299 RepID=UPI002E7BB396|nr:hypothetical protein [Candidatus Vondammii sp. HM_W22]